MSKAIEPVKVRWDVFRRTQSRLLGVDNWLVWVRLNGSFQRALLSEHMRNQAINEIPCYEFEKAYCGCPL